MAPRQAFPRNFEATLARCALGVLAVGLSVGVMAQLAFEVLLFIWDAVPYRGVNYGAEGYIRPFLTSLGDGLTSAQNLWWAFQFVPWTACFVGGVLLLRGGPGVTRLLRRAVR